MLKKVADIKKTYSTDGRLVLDNFAFVIDEVPEGTVFHAGFSALFGEKLTVSNWENGIKTATVKFVEITGREKAAEFLDKALFVNDKTFRLISSHYDNTSDVVGLRALNVADGSEIGVIEEVWNLPANDVWLCVDETSELPLPVIDSVIKKIDYKKGVVYVELVEGLTDIRNEKKPERKPRK